MTRRFASTTAAVALALLALARPAWAHDDDAPSTPMDPSAFAGAGKLLLLIAVVVVGGAVWYYMRRRAIIREGKAASRPD